MWIVIRSEGFDEYSVILIPLPSTDVETNITKSVTLDVKGGKISRLEVKMVTDYKLRSKSNINIVFRNDVIRLWLLTIGKGFGNDVLMRIT